MSHLTEQDRERILSEHSAQSGFGGVLSKMGFRRPPTGEEAATILKGAERDAERTARATEEAELSRVIMQNMPSEFSLRPIRVVVLGTKGGVGKTAQIVMIAKIIASLRRNQQTTLVNADPSVGSNLSVRALGAVANDSSRLPAAQAPSIDNIVRHYDQISRGELRVDSFLQKSPGEAVTVLPIGDDPEQISGFDSETLDKMLDALRNYSSFLFVDNGAEATNKFALASLSKADALVIVTDNTDDAHDGLRKVSQFVAQRFPSLADRTLLLVNRKAVAPKGMQATDLRPLDSQTIAGIGRGYGINAWTEFPYDPNLALGGKIDVQRLTGQARLAAMRAAAHLVSIISTSATQP